MVDRSHHFPPPDAPDCTLCADSGFNKWTGRWDFCGCEAGNRERLKDPFAASSMNFALGKLEGKTK